MASPVYEHCCRIEISFTGPVTTRSSSGQKSQRIELIREQTLLMKSGTATKIVESWKKLSKFSFEGYEYNKVSCQDEWVEFNGENPVLPEDSKVRFISAVPKKMVRAAHKTGIFS